MPGAQDIALTSQPVLDENSFALIKTLEQSPIFWEKQITGDQIENSEEKSSSHSESITYNIDANS